MKDWILRLIAASALLLAGSAEAAAQELADMAASGNKSSIEMIATYFAEVKLVKLWEASALGRKGGILPDGIRSAKYWRDRSRVRITEQIFLKNLDADASKNQPATKKTVDVEISGSQAWVVPTTADGKHTHHANATGAIIGEKDRRFADVDPWELSLFCLPHGLFSKPSVPRYTLAEALQKGQVKTAEWSKVGDLRLAHLIVELAKTPKRVYEIWVDPARNWLITKCIYQYNPDADPRNDWRLEYEVEQWAEPEPSLFIPTRVMEKVWLHGKHLNDAIATFETVHVNGPMPPMPSMPSLLAGTLVHDETRGEFYRVDGNGKKMMGSVSRALGNYEPPLPAADPLAPVSPFRNAGWILVGVALLIGTGGAALWWRRRVRHAAT